MTKLYVACHKPSYVPDNPLLYPIQVGSAQAERHFEGFLHDDTGDHISEKNPQYCELTAQYWAWKNDVADYYGFFHYRRYLYPDLSAKLPYKIEKGLDAGTLERLNYDTVSELIEGHVLIAPIGEDMHLSVRQHYADAPHHRSKDLELVEDIIRRNYPHYVDAMEQYLGGTICYFGNIYIMKHNLFHDYCGWLFGILAEFDQRADLTGYSQQELRVNGYLAERLFGVYYTQKKAEGVERAELPRVHFLDSDLWLSTKIRYVLLPPGTKRRAVVKRISIR